MRIKDCVNSYCRLRKSQGQGSLFDGSVGFIRGASECKGEVTTVDVSVGDLAFRRDIETVEILSKEDHPEYYL